MERARTKHLIGKRDFFFTPTGDCHPPWFALTAPEVLAFRVQRMISVGQEMLWEELSHACREVRRGEGETVQAGIPLLSASSSSR